jgi:tetratricopeptide (TPR) repeat protein
VRAWTTWPFRRSGLALLVLLVAALPLARGGVDLPARIAALAVSAVALLLVSRRDPVPLALPAAALWGVSGFVAFQLVPLPPWLLGALSPAAASHAEAFLGPLGLYPAWRPLSLDPGATSGALAEALACACVATATAAATVPEGKGRQETILAAVALGGPAAAAGTLFAALAGLTPAVEPRFVFVNPNHLAALLDLTAFVSLGFAVRERGSRRWTWLVAFVGSATVLLLTLSRGGIAAFLLGGAAFAALLARRARLRPGGRRALGWLLVPAAGAVALAAGAFLAEGPLLRALRTVPGVPDEAKLAMWPVAARLAARFPVSGIGRGAFATVYPNVKLDPSPVTSTHVENEWLQAVIDLGFPAGLLALGALAVAWLAAAKRRDLSRPEIGAAAGLFALGAQVTFDFSLDLLGIAIPAFVLLAAISRPTRAALRPRVAGGAALLALGVGGAGLAVEARTDPDRAAAAIAASSPDHAPALARLAVSWHPADYLPHAAAGAALASARRCAEALPWLSRAMLLDATAAEPHRYTADCLARAREKELALREYRLALAFGDAGALGAAAARYPALQDLLRVAPETPEGLRAAGTWLAPVDASEAERAFGRAWDEYGDREALEPLARTALAAADPVRAEQAARALVASAPSRPAGHLLLHRALVALGREDEAWAALEEGAARAPGALEVLEPLAMRAASRRRFAEARRILAGVVPRNAAEAATRRLLEARVLRAQGRLLEAAAELEGAAAALPRSPAPLEDLADLLVALGRHDDAVAALRRAAAISPARSGEYQARIARIEAARAAATAETSR